MRRSDSRVRIICRNVEIQQVMPVANYGMLVHVVGARELELHAEKARDGIAHRAPPFGDRRVHDVIGSGVNGTPKIIALCSAMALKASRLVSSSISQHAPVQGPAFVARERP
jgi:hypothetical protein